jgi:glycosyltransferase involved in cell wall biosynthesis
VVSALRADRVVFNSDYHRREFLQALPAFLAELPDEAPPELAEIIASKSRTLHLGCDLRGLDEVRPDGRIVSGRYGRPEDGPLVVWNQRWEYDKNPARLFEALMEVARQGVPFRVALAGAGQGEPSQVFVQGRRALGDRVVQWGKVEGREEYARLLFEADVVVSTALHEFFGAAVVEAVYCGCRPVLPRRLSYPELIPAAVHDRVLYDERELSSFLARVLAEPLPPWSAEWQRTWVARFDWGNMSGLYDDEIWSVWAEASRSD